MDDEDYAAGLYSESGITNAIDRVRLKKNLPALGKLRFEKLSGRSLRADPARLAVYRGRATIQKLHDYIDGKADQTGKHPEIYLSEIRRAFPMKAKS